MKRKYLISIALVLCLLIVGAGSAEAKSAYVIANLNANPIPVQAYDVQTNLIVLQETNYIPDRNGGAVGLAIDSDSAYLFATYEFSGVIEIIDATTMNSKGQVSAPGASNLAGIVVDEDKNKVYTAHRGSNNLYVYDWDATTETLTPDPIALPGDYIDLLGSAIHPATPTIYGIALDEINDILYVSSYPNNIIRYYDTNTWACLGSFTTTPRAMGIAVDANRGFVYSGGWSDYMISKYDLSDGTETIQVVGGSTKPIGFAVDDLTGNVLVTTKDGSAPYRDVLLMYDSNLVELHKTTDLGDPTGVTVPRSDISYNKLNLEKTDGVTTVLEGGQLTYTITFDNVANNDLVTGITLVDKLPPEVTFVEATGPLAAYDDVNHEVSWTIDDLAANAPIQTVTVTVTVNSGTLGSTLNNAVTINGNEQGTGPTTRHDADTTVVASNGGEIPEFPTIVLPMAAILGLAFIFQRRKD